VRALPIPPTDPLSKLTRNRRVAHVFTDLNATSKGVSLGLMSTSALKVEVGPSQPFVEILGRKVGTLISSRFMRPLRD